jgi:hypothetical protein
MFRSFRVTVVAVAMCGLAVPVSAQTPTPPASSDAAKSQVRTFEMVLKSAVETGTRNFAQRAAEMVPQLFSVVDPPAVNGVVVHVQSRSDYVFHIQVPMIWPMLQVMIMNQRLMPRAAAGAPGRQTVAGGARVQADGTPDADSMDGSGVTAANRPELEREYGRKVRDALVDAILDNSAVLPIVPSDTLVVFASVPDSGVPPSLYQDPVPRKLILSMTGADLTDLRQGRITREQAKAKVIEEHF